MKKLFTLCLALITLFAVCAYAETVEEVWIDIDTPEALAAIADDPFGHYRLTCDIDMTGVEWLPIKFAGVLDGQGHAIMNLHISQTGETGFTTVDGNSKRYKTVGAGLFDCALNAEIHDVSLLGFEIVIQTDLACFCGAFIGGGNNVSLKNCNAVGRIMLRQSARMCGIGGLLGYAFGEVSYCNADTDLVFIDTNKAETCEEFCSGVLACGHASINHCNIEVDMYTSVHGFVHNGGLVGMHERGQTKSAKEYLDHNTVDMDVTYFEDAPFKRSYNDPYIGEEENTGAHLESNTTKHYHRENTHNFNKYIYPCTCGVEASLTVTPPTESSYGYTLHACPKCGYAYKDTYTAPVLP